MPLAYKTALFFYPHHPWILTLSLTRVTNFRWKNIILPILTTSLVHFSFRVWKMYKDSQFSSFAGEKQYYWSASTTIQPERISVSWFISCQFKTFGTMHPDHLQCVFQRHSQLKYVLLLTAGRTRKFGRWFYPLSNLILNYGHDFQLLWMTTDNSSLSRKRTNQCSLQCCIHLTSRILRYFRSLKSQPKQWFKLSAGYTLSQ